MKKMILLSIPFMLFAYSFQELTSLVNNSLIIKQQRQYIKIQKAKIGISKAKNYGSLDASYNATYFQDSPAIKINIAGTKEIIQSGLKDNYIGAITYSYPLFNGFAINANINKAKLHFIKAKLKLKDDKRVLILNIAKLYSLIYAKKELIKALQFSKIALLNAKSQIKLSFIQGLVDMHEVDNINAKYYELIAKLQNIKTQKNNLLRTLSYLVNKQILSISTLPTLKKVNFLIPRISSRADVLVIQKELAIDNQNIKIAKSRFYPTVEAQVAIKRVANLVQLNKNYYQNKNQSYVAIEIKYNIFNGDADKSTLEAKELQKLSTTTFYDNYLKNILKNYYNNVNNYKALKIRLTAVQKAKIASKSYFTYMQARFKQGLISSIDLNYAISELAKSNAEVAQIKADLFFLHETLLLNGNFI